MKLKQSFYSLIAAMMPLVSVFADVNPYDYHIDYGCWGTITLTEGNTETLYSQFDFQYESKIISIDWTVTYPENLYVSISEQDRYSCTIKGEMANREAKVWCLAKYGGGTYKAYYLVKVKEAPPKPTSITVSPSTMSITVGNTQKADYSLSPNNASTSVTWSSDDTSIATVGTYTGEVKGVGVGTTYIRAKTSNGKTDYCIVTVGPEVGIQIDDENFPNDDFREYLINRFGEILSDGEINNTTSIKIDYVWKLDLKGIEFFTNLKQLSCYGNLFRYDRNGKTVGLDLSKNLTLEKLILSHCSLSSLDVSSNKSLTYIDCSLNNIKGSEMSNLINSLPVNSEGVSDFVVMSKSDGEGNLITKSQVAWARRKGWTTYYKQGDWLIQYEGSDPEKGDLNEDGVVDESDLLGLSKYIMGKDRDIIAQSKADINGDQKVNVADIVELINIIKANK